MGLVPVPAVVVTAGRADALTIATTAKTKVTIAVNGSYAPGKQVHTLLDVYDLKVRCLVRFSVHCFYGVLLFVRRFACKVTKSF